MSREMGAEKITSCPIMHAYDVKHVISNSIACICVGDPASLPGCTMSSLRASLHLHLQGWSWGHCPRVQSELLLSNRD